MFPTRILLVAVLLVAAATTNAAAQRETFGEPFSGWKFTQEAAPSGAILCRAEYKDYALGLDTHGMSGLSIPAGKITNGEYPDSTIEVGSYVEPVQGRSNRGRFWTYDMDSMILDAIGPARGYKWRVALKNGRIVEGRVQLPDSTTSALERIYECIAANGG